MAPEQVDVDLRYRLTIGRRLRGLRERSGRSLRQAAASSGLSHTFIRMVEQGQSEIAVGRLLRLVESYGAYAGDVLADAGPSGPELTRAGEAFIVASPDDMTVTFLSTPSWMLQPFEVSLAPGTSMEDLHHHGDEFIFGLTGKISVRVVGELFELSPGDSLMIPQYTTHSFHNNGAVPASYVGAVPRSGETTLVSGEQQPH